MEGLCKYKDILGKPGEGVHKKRVCGLAAFDIFGTMLVSLLIYLKWGGNIIIILLLLFVIGEALHLAFCVDTPVTRYIKSYW